MNKRKELPIKYLSSFTEFVISKHKWWRQEMKAQLSLSRIMSWLRHPTTLDTFHIHTHTHTATLTHKSFFLFAKAFLRFRTLKYLKHTHHTTSRIIPRLPPSNIIPHSPPGSALHWPGLSRMSWFASNRFKLNRFALKLYSTWQSRFVHSSQP